MLLLQNVDFNKRFLDLQLQKALLSNKTFFLFAHPLGNNFKKIEKHSKFELTIFKIIVQK